MSIEWRTLANGQVEVIGEGVIAPSSARLAQIRSVTERWGGLARKHSARTSVPRSWILATITIESNGVETATGADGEAGLMQIMPEGWGGRTRDQMNDPDTNVGVGTNLLARSRAAGLSLPKAASVYNCGSASGKTITPKLVPSTRWGMCAHADYIDQIVRANNGAIALATPASSPSSTSSSSSIPLPVWILLARLAWKWWP